MHNRLKLCHDYLKDVEAKLIKVRNQMDSPEEAGRAMEALSLVQLALKAVSETRAKVEALPEATKTFHERSLTPPSDDHTGV